MKPGISAPSKTTEWLENAITGGLGTLRSAYEVYWPSAGNNDAKERNLSLYAAHALLNEGFLSFGEANFPDEPNQRLDLLAFHKKKGILVLGECKRCYSTEKLEGMLWDVDRIASFPHVKMPVMEVREVYGVLIASTSKETYRHWWVDGTKPPLGVRRKEPWAELYARLGEEPTRWSSVPLGDNYHALLVVFPLPLISSRSSR